MDAIFPNPRDFRVMAYHFAALLKSVVMEIDFSTVAAYDKISASPPKADNPVDWGCVNWGPLIIGDKVTASWLGETRDFKW